VTRSSREKLERLIAAGERARVQRRRRVVRQVLVLALAGVCLLVIRNAYAGRPEMGRGFWAVLVGR
jgi:hypothetical protein